MKPDYNICDCCKTNFVRPSDHTALYRGTEYNGVEYVDNYDTYDLCDKCLIRILSKTSDRNVEFATEFKKVFEHEQLPK